MAAPDSLLIPGATYSHGYWDFGSMSGVTYSYARAVAAEGIATFTIDRTVRRRVARPQAAGKRQRRSTFSVRQGVAARSVPDQVMREANCPVLAVPPPGGTLRAATS